MVKPGLRKWKKLKWNAPVYCFLNSFPMHTLCIQSLLLQMPYVFSAGHMMEEDVCQQCPHFIP